MSQRWLEVGITSAPEIDPTAHDTARRRTRRGDELLTAALIEARAGTGVAAGSEEERRADVGVSIDRNGPVAPGALVGAVAGQEGRVGLSTTAGKFSICGEA
jgi:hypothetical protein